jgi:hypothetical protein
MAASKNTNIPSYSKQQFLGSQRFASPQKDVLASLLEDEKSYTAQEVDELLEQFLSKEVE